MKRSELEVGMEVEIQRGTEYKTFTRAVIVDTVPWKNTGSFDRRHPRQQVVWSLPAELGEWRPASSGNGVAVAAEHRNFRGELFWEPRVVQLSSVKPVGTAAAEDTARKQRRADEEAAAAYRNAKDADLANRLGVEEYQVRSDSAGRISISRELIEELLDAAGR